MTHPFEDDTADYVVLANDRTQYSLWPATIAVPPGWRTVRGPAARQDCLDFVTAHWRDLQPAAGGTGD